MSNSRPRPGNPWVAAGRRVSDDDPSPANDSATPEKLEADPVLGDDTVAANGPLEPPLTVPAGQDGFRTERVAGNPELWIFGLHGGAGTSTVAGLLADFGMTVSETRAWPQPPSPNSPAPVLLVARTHGAGLAALRTAARQWAAGDLPFVSLVGTVLVADGPNPARKLKAEIAASLAQTPKTWHIGWHEEWRSAVAGSDRAASVRTRLTLSSIIRQWKETRRGQEGPQTSDADLEAVTPPSAPSGPHLYEGSYTYTVTVSRAGQLRVNGEDVAPTDDVGASSADDQLAWAFAAIQGHWAEISGQHPDATLRLTIEDHRPGGYGRHQLRLHGGDALNLNDLRAQRGQVSDDGRMGGKDHVGTPLWEAVTEEGA